MLSEAIITYCFPFLKVCFTITHTNKCCFKFIIDNKLFFSFSCGLGFLLSFSERQNNMFGVSKSIFESAFNKLGIKNQELGISVREKGKGDLSGATPFLRLA